MNTIELPAWLSTIFAGFFLEGQSAWESFVFLIGMLAILYAILNIFTSLTNVSPPGWIRSPVSTHDMHHFLNTLSSAINAPVLTGEKVEVLVDGPAFLEDLLREIRSATEYINITNYIWKDGSFGNTLLTSLTERARAGISVRLLVDGIGGRKMNKKYRQELEDAGGQVAFFRPVTWWNITRINRRNHVREFVIDGKVAYIGGVAIEDKWLGDSNAPTFWHDFMFKVRGEMAQVSSGIFSNMWCQTTGEIFTNGDNIGRQGSSKPINRFISLFSVPSPDMSANMDHFIWLSIMAAEKYIYFENPYVIPSKAILKALTSKAEKGIDVRVIVPGTYTDTPTVQWASQSYYYELLNAGVKIYEYNVSRIHSKIMVIDGIWSIIGSANLDNRSSQLNIEAIMGIDDRDLASRLETEMHKDIGKSKEVSRNHWRSRILLRPFGLLSRLFTQQF